MRIKTLLNQCQKYKSFSFIKEYIKDRTAKTLLRFFFQLGKERCKKIKYVCSDMWKAYLKVIKKKIPQALHILDRSHIVAKLNDAVDEVRRTEAKQSD